MIEWIEVNVKKWGLFMILVTLFCLLLLLIFIPLLFINVNFVFPASRKQKGSAAILDKRLPAKLNNSGIRYFKCLGLEFTDPNHKFYVLNELGEDYVLGPLHDIFQKHIVYISRYYDVNFDFINSIQAILCTTLKTPFKIFNISGPNSYNTGLVSLPSTDIEREEMLKLTGELNFGEILGHVKGGVRVARRYEELCDFMKESFGGYFDEVSFIGQPTFFAEPAPEEKNESVLEGVRFSLDKRFTKGDSVYKACKDLLRNWYTSTFDKFFVRHYFNKIVSSDKGITDSSIDYYVKPPLFPKDFLCVVNMEQSVPYLEGESLFYRRAFEEVESNVGASLDYFVEKTVFLFNHVVETMGVQGLTSEDLIKVVQRNSQFKNLKRKRKDLINEIEGLENNVGRISYKEKDLLTKMQRILVFTLGENLKSEEEFNKLFPFLTGESEMTPGGLTSTHEVLLPLLKPIEKWYTKRADLIRDSQNCDEKKKFYEDSSKELRDGRYPSVKNIVEPGKKMVYNNNNDSDDVEGEATGDYADIYPALKLFMSVFLIFGYRLEYIKYRKGLAKEDEIQEDNVYEGDFFEMVVSYVIYAHLFNIFCCVRMEPTWNEKIGNLYVYNYNTERKNENKMEVDKTSYDEATIDFALECASSYGVLKGMIRAGEKFGKKKFLSVIKKKEDIFREYSSVISVLRHFSPRDWLCCESENKKVNMILNVLYDFVEKNVDSKLDTLFDFYMFEDTHCKILIEPFKKIEEAVLEFLECNSDIEEKYSEVEQLLEDNKILDNKYSILLTLAMLADVYAYTSGLNKGDFGKMEKILLYFKEYLTEYQDKEEIIDLFRKNKSILLFFLDNEILQFDDTFIKFLINDPYDEKSFMFFAPEIVHNTTKSESLEELKMAKEKCCEEYIRDMEVPNDVVSFFDLCLDTLNKDSYFSNKRKLGVNDDKIAMLIREDNIKSFTPLFESMELTPESEIKKSIFDTNQFLIEKESPSLLEYSLFYGAKQITRFLVSGRCLIHPGLLEWSYAGKYYLSEMAEKLLEDNNVNRREPKKYLLNAVRAHNYTLFNFIEGKYDIKLTDICLLPELLMNHNFVTLYSGSGFEKEVNKSLILSILCEFKYYPFIMSSKMNTTLIGQEYNGMLLSLCGIGKADAEKAVREGYNGDDFIKSILLDNELEKPEPQHDNIIKWVKELPDSYFSDSRLRKIYEFMKEISVGEINADENEIIDKLETFLKEKGIKIWENKEEEEEEEEHDLLSGIKGYLFDMLKEKCARYVIIEIFKYTLSAFRKLRLYGSVHMSVILKRVLKLFIKFPLLHSGIERNEDLEEEVIKRTAKVKELFANVQAEMRRLSDIQF